MGLTATKEYPESDLIPLSALQHLLFCPRQCALIHLEREWVENRYTAEGRVMHEKADSGGREARGDKRVAFSLTIRSLKLGLAGKADVVEFFRTDSGSWQPFPVEYKRGKPKRNDCDRVQLCAQALCLEEMLEVEIPAGALFYGKSKRRHEIAFDESLRETTKRTAANLHRLVEDGETPLPEYSKKCDLCSMNSICLPKTLNADGTVEEYYRRTFGAMT